ncbi:MAG TPA: YicC/YloC family endoribonuclease [Gemmatimonadales bacterium]|nr:YicC/YloC family endoribonuclease [Gemmatimonadales bacterium]
MTGFGAGEGNAAGGRLRVEIRTVNHRFFNLSAKLPSDLAPLEPEFRERLRRELERGHISVSVRWIESPAREAALALNLDRARVVVARMRELQTSLGLAGEISLDLVARQPQVLVFDGNEVPTVSWADLEPIVAAAVAECAAMRRREGAALAAELAHRLDLLETAARQVASLAPARLPRERDRLRAAVGELLDGRAIDEARLAQELAVLADKLDITEELVRFAAHVAACRAALAGDAPVGKQLGFLAQELGREINTMGSKANDAEISQQVIRMKGEMEKFREQLENLE